MMILNGQDDIKGVQQMIKLSIKELIKNDTEKMKIFPWSNNVLLRESPFQHVRSNFERRIAIQHLKYNSKSQCRFRKGDLIGDLPPGQRVLYFPK
jgi:hypothetical protein